MDICWSHLDISRSYIEARADWIAEMRQLHWRSHRYFSLAAKLLRLAADDYQLAGCAFLYSAFGLERALTVHFCREKDSFAANLAKAVANGELTDGALREPPQVPPKRLLHEFGIDPVAAVVTYCDAFRILLPAVRNSNVHSDCAVSPHFLSLSISARELADALATITKREKCRIAD